VRRVIHCLCLIGAMAASGCGGEHTQVVMETSMGDVTIELFDNDAPITVANFLAYVDEKHYDGTVFARVMPGFMIQGGGFTTDYKRKPQNLAIKNESFNRKPNTRGTIAMAREKDPDSATDEFYINVVDNKHLNRNPAENNDGWCVFGKVIQGMDVVDQIQNVKTHVPGDVPLEPVVIKSIRRLKKASG
jgi:cyclophilin family peptidyl-prolyl cis-trans isomerase